MSKNVELYNVNGKIVLTGKIDKINKKIVNPVGFYMRPLNFRDAHAMGELSACIYENLDNGQECFIHKHEKEYFKNIFNDENVKYIGVFVGKNLIAMSYFRELKNSTELQEELPNHGLDFSKGSRLDELGVKNPKIASLGADSVHPDFRGNNLNHYMIKYRVALAKQMKFTDCISIIDRKNIWNMTPYFDNGFNMFSSSIDPADEGKIYLMHRPLREKVKVLSNDIEKIEFKNFGNIDNMLNNGYVGCDFDKSKNQISFLKTYYYSDLKVKKNERNGSNVKFFGYNKERCFV